MIRMMIVSNLSLLREALCFAMSTEDGFEVTGASGTDREVLALAAQTSADVAVVDLDAPSRDGLRTVRLLAEKRSVTAVVALSARDTPGVLRRALSAGARGFASRNQAPDELAAIVRRVARGELVIHSATALAMVAVMENPLSEREQEVLRLAARGLPSEEIGTRLFLTKGTVRNYLSGAMRKLGCANRLEAACRAEEAGWL